MLDNFELKKIEIRKKHIYFNKVVEFYLDYRNIEQMNLSPNGSTEYTRVSDFHLRKRLCTLYILSRNFENEQCKNTFICEFPIGDISVSLEYADFLKLELDKRPVPAKWV